MRFVFSLLAALSLLVPSVAPGCSPSTGDIYIGGLFDYSITDRYHFSFAADLINNKTDGFFDSLLPGLTLQTTTRNSACDVIRGTEAAWQLVHDWAEPLHGIVGARCSSSSMGVATVMRLADVPQVSARSTSSALSDTEAYSHFFRTCAPDDRQGPALRALVSAFGWERVGIITSELTYSVDVANDFAGGWSGTVATRCTIPLNGTARLRTDSIQECFQTIAELPPADRPRIILLTAHKPHALQILQHATATEWQPDTVWLGTDSWTGQELPSSISYQVLGIRPASNAAGAQYLDYLMRWNTAQQLAGQTPDELLCGYCAETVDAMLALVMALNATYASGTTPAESYAFVENGTNVLLHLKQVAFEGLSGPISFDEYGDRRNQKWEAMHAEANVMEWATSGVYDVSFSSQSTWPAGPNGAVPADSYANALGGAQDCPCMDARVIIADNISSSCTYFSAVAGFNTQRHCYPPSYGSSVCAPHDAALGPYCTGVNPPAFCGERWCYIDHTKCKASKHVFRISNYHQSFAGSEDKLYFSYSTCNGTSSRWDEHITLTALQDMSLLATAPGIEHPAQFKMTTSGKVVKEYNGEAYYNDSSPWLGAIPEYLNALAELSGQISDFNISSRSRGSSVIRPGSSYTASVHDVQAGISHVGAAPFYVTSERLRMVPFTTPLYVDEVVLWIQRPVWDNTLGAKMMTVSAPFDGGLWATLLLSTFVVSVFNIWFAAPGEPYDRWVSPGPCFHLCRERGYYTKSDSIVIQQ